MSTPLPPRAPAPRLGPAFIVVGVAFVIVVLGAVVALAGSASAHAPVGQLGSKLPGTALRALPATSYLAHITVGKEPPPDVVKQLSVPAASKYLSSTSPDAEVDQFDRGISFVTPDPAKQVAAFYKADLASGHWSLQFDGTADGHLELIGQKNASDGYQWRVAVVITTVDPAISPALAGSNATSTSKTEMTLYQVADAS